MNTIKKVFNWIEDGIEYIAMGALAVMVVLIFSQVFCRYVLHFTPRWSEESAIIMMIWVSFIGLALGVKKEIHLTITFFVDLFPKFIRNIILILDQILIMIFGIVIVIYGADLSIHTMTSTLPATQLPSSVLYMVLPLSGVFIIIYTAIKMIQLVAGKETK